MIFCNRLLSKLRSMVCKLRFFRKKSNVVSLIISLLFCINIANADEISKLTPFISISGEHSVLIKHDQATINGSIKTYDIKADKAVSENASIINNIKKSLRKNGYNQNDLISNGYNLRRNYDYQKGTQIFRDYQVTHNISFTINDIKKIGNIADILINSGMNNISNIRFKSSKAKQAYDKALKNAVQNAYNKAVLAVSYDDKIKIGKALSINVNGSNQIKPPVINYDMAEKRSVMAASVPTELNTKGQEVNVKVTTKWELIY